MTEEVRIVLTGFMGVGKSTVAKHLASMLKCEKLDLDSEISAREEKSIADIIDTRGIDEFRRIESETLRKVLETGAQIVALGGGAFTVPANRSMIKERNFTSIWLETSFERCWLNIIGSRRVRPLARDKTAARKLFDDRNRIYCLADWHFIVKPEHNSYEVARQIAVEVFSMEFGRDMG